MNTPSTWWYNPYLRNLISDDSTKIAYDKKIYNALDWFITEHLWEKLDDELLEKIAFILDDPKHEYPKDIEMTKLLLRHFLPTLKKKLWIHKFRPLYKKIYSKELVVQKNTTDIVEENIPITTNPLFLDRLIQQQLNIYHTNETMSLLQALSQGENDKKASDTMVFESKNTRKSIIATILSCMLLEEEYKTQKAKYQNKIFHKFNKDTK